MPWKFRLGIICLRYCRRVASNTPLDMNVRWIDAIYYPGVPGYLTLLTLVVILSFGVHYGSVGSWLPRFARWSKTHPVTVRAGIANSNRGQ